MTLALTYQIILIFHINVSTQIIQMYPRVSREQLKLSRFKNFEGVFSGDDCFSKYIGDI